MTLKGKISVLTKGLDNSTIDIHSLMRDFWTNRTQVQLSLYGTSLPIADHLFFPTEDRWKMTRSENDEPEPEWHQDFIDWTISQYGISPIVHLRAPVTVTTGRSTSLVDASEERGRIFQTMDLGKKTEPADKIRKEIYRHLSEDDGSYRPSGLTFDSEGHPKGHESWSVDARCALTPKTKTLLQKMGGDFYRIGGIRFIVEEKGEKFTDVVANYVEARHGFRPEVKDLSIFVNTNNAFPVLTGNVPQDFLEYNNTVYNVNTGLIEKDIKIYAKGDRAEVNIPHYFERMEIKDEEKLALVLEQLTNYAVSSGKSH